MEDKVSYVVIYKNGSNEQVVNNFDDIGKATAFYQQKVSELSDCSLLKVIAESKAPQCKDCPRLYDKRYHCYLGRRGNDPVCSSYASIVKNASSEFSYDEIENFKFKCSKNKCQGF